MKVKPAVTAGEVVMELDRGDELLMEKASMQRSPFVIKNILVPVDFSECSEKALRYAIPLAEQNKAAITLLHVLPASYPTGGLRSLEYVQLQRDMRANAEGQLSALAAREARATVPVTSRIVEAPPADAIVRAAKELPADIIVISTHGRTGLKHVLLGSVAEHLVRRAPCPVLVVREREHECLQPAIKTA